MHYFGVNYCQRHWFRSFSDYAFWVTRCSQRTCFYDINIRFFMRILGIEFTVLYWVPRDKRRYKCIDYSKGPHIVGPLCCLNADIWGDCVIHGKGASAFLGEEQ